MCLVSSTPGGHREEFTPSGPWPSASTLAKAANRPWPPCLWALEPRRQAVALLPLSLRGPERLWVAAAGLSQLLVLDPRAAPLCCGPHTQVGRGASPEPCFPLCCPGRLLSPMLMTRAPPLREQQGWEAGQPAAQPLSLARALSLPRRPPLPPASLLREDLHVQAGRRVVCLCDPQDPHTAPVPRLTLSRWGFQSSPAAVFRSLCWSPRGRILLSVSDAVILCPAFSGRFLRPQWQPRTTQGKGDGGSGGVSGQRGALGRGL